MTEPKWKIVKNAENAEIAVVRVWPDGKYESASLQDQAYLAWLAEGNVPTPADEQGEQQ